MQIALFYHLCLCSDSRLLSHSLVAPYDFHVSHTLFPLGCTGPISSHWQGPRAKAPGRTQEQGKYRGRHPSFPLLTSDDQNLTSPSLRLPNGGGIKFNRPWGVCLPRIYPTNSSTPLCFSHLKCCGVMSSTAELRFMWKKHLLMLVLSHNSSIYSYKPLSLSQSFHQVIFLTSREYSAHWAPGCRMSTVAGCWSPPASCCPLPLWLHPPHFRASPREGRRQSSTSRNCARESVHPSATETF